MILLKPEQMNIVSGGESSLTFTNALWDLNGYVAGAAIGLFAHYAFTGLPFWTPYPGPAVYAMVGGSCGATVVHSLYNKA